MGDHLVTDRMPVLAVDQLQAVDVQGRHDTTARLGQHLPLGQQRAAVQQPGERILQGGAGAGVLPKRQEEPAGRVSGP